MKKNLTTFVLLFAFVIGVFAQSPFGLKGYWKRYQNNIYFDGGYVAIGKLSANYLLDLDGDCNLSDGYVYRINGENLVSIISQEIEQGDWYGVSWDATEDTYQRLGSLSDSSASSTIPDALLPIQAAMKRCVVADDGTVEYYLDPSNSTKKANGQTANIDTSGTIDGQVMVEIPEFYHYHHYDAATNVHTWKVSLFSIPGFTKVDTCYIGAYQASLYDASAGVFVGDAVSTYASGDKLCSLTGIKPKVNETIVEFRAAAEARGSGWHLLDNKTMHAVQILYLTEFANFNSQTKLGNGNTTDPNNDGFVYATDIAPTGKSNSDGNFSGGANTDDSTDYVSYRGIEDILGNLWCFLDGVNVNNDGSSSKLYLATNYDDYASDTSTGYTLFGNLAETDGYVLNLMNITSGFYASTVGGSASSSTFITDYYYTYYDNNPSVGWRVALVGGPASYGGWAGVFYVSAYYGSSYADSTIGARLCRN